MRVFVVCGVLFLGAALAAAEDATLTDDTLTVRTEGAHRLLLPNDWPVEYKDGLVSPVSIEQYLSMKFGQVAGRLEEVNRRLASADQRLAALEEQQKILQIRLKRLEEQPREGR